MKSIKENNERFQDENITILNFINEVLVHCPKCDKKAIVIKDELKYPEEIRLKCFECHYSRIESCVYYTFQINHLCSNCDHRIIENKSVVKIDEKPIKLRCPNCKAIYDHEPKYTKVSVKYSIFKDGFDPYMKLPLWIKNTFKGHVFWAYNHGHLAYLKKYISAKIRERNDRQHYTMVEKLPDWIKSSKNRNTIIKLIEKLEKK